MQANCPFRMSRSSAGILAFIIAFMGATTVTHAEGGGKRSSGDTGVNRRVVTLPGYVSVQATGTMTFRVASGKASIAWGDSPCFYLGGIAQSTPYLHLATGQWTASRATIDAGIEYEPDQVLDNSGNVLLQPGLAAVISRNGDYCNPKIWLKGQSSAWRVPSKGDPYTATLTFNFYPDTGTCSLTIDTLPNGQGTGGTFYWEATGKANPFVATAANPLGPIQTNADPIITGYTTFDPANCIVKRNVGISRYTHDEDLNGSWVQCTFTECQVQHYWETSLHYWDIPEVWQSGDMVTNFFGWPGFAGSSPTNPIFSPTFQDAYSTGFDAHPNGSPKAQAWDMRINGAEEPGISRTIVEFPNIGRGDNGKGYNPDNIVARTESDASHQLKENGNSRYREETVRINLRLATAPHGHHSSPSHKPSAPRSQPSTPSTP